MVDVRMEHLDRDLLRALGLDARSLSRGVRAMAVAVHAEIKRMAERDLTSTAAAYKQALTQFGGGVEHRGLEASVMLAGRPAIAGMIEQGWPGGDMREWLLKPGPGVRRSAAGHLYRFIPFRHRTPGRKGGTLRPGMMGGAYGSAGRSGGRVQEGRKLGMAVHRAAKKLEASRTEFVHAGRSGGLYQQTTHGGRLAEGVGGAQRLKGHHRTDIYAGMIREEKHYAKATQSQYMTFRAISTNPDSIRSDESWKHPGLHERNFFERGAQWVENQWPEYFQGYAMGG